MTQTGTDWQVSRVLGGSSPPLCKTGNHCPGLWNGRLARPGRYLSSVGGRKAAYWPPRPESISPAIRATLEMTRLTAIVCVCFATVVSGCKSKRNAEAKPDASEPLTPLAPVAPPESPHPATLFARDQPQASSLRLDGGFVYWKTENLETEKGGVSRVASSGTKIERVIVDQKNLVSFTTGEGGIFWSIDDDERTGIYAKSLDGGTSRRLAKRSTWTRALYEDAGNVFWAEFGSLFRVSTKGGTVSRVYERAEGPGGDSDTLAGADGDIYWSLDDAVLAVRSDGSGFRKLATGFRQVRGLTVAATSVFVADAGDGTTGAVYRVDRKTGAKTTLLASAARPWSVFAIGAHVYIVGNAARGAVTRVNLDGTGASLFAANLTYGTSVVADDRTVFWTNAEPGSLWKAAR